MTCWRGALAVWLILTMLTTAPARAFQPPPEEQGSFLGVLFSPVSDALYDHLPHLPRFHWRPLARSWCSPS